MRTFIGDRCIQLLGLEAIEALAAKSEGARANFEQVRSVSLSLCLYLFIFLSLPSTLFPKQAKSEENND